MCEEGARRVCRGCEKGAGVRGFEEGVSGV